ncbi:MAG: ABC transporter permease [Verrucomicrobiota bacterium]
MNIIQTVTHHWDLIANLVGRDLKSRYRGSAVGLLWTVLNPLFMAVIYVFFLRLLAGSRVGVAVEDIIIGVFAWQFTVHCIHAGMDCFTGNANLVKKVYFPRIILPLSVSFSALVNFAITVVVQIVLVAVLLHLRGLAPSAWTFALPLLALYQTLFNLALILLLSAANVYFRDTQHVVSLLISAWFFMSPVMYPLSFVEAVGRHVPWLMDVYMLNPLAVIITGYRTLQVPGEAFPWSYAAVAGWIWPMLFLVLAYIVFQKAQRYFSDVI